MRQHVVDMRRRLSILLGDEGLKHRAEGAARLSLEEIIVEAIRSLEPAGTSA